MNLHHIKTCFHTEARGNSKIAFCQVVLLALGIVFKFILSHLLILIRCFIAGMLLNQIWNKDNETWIILNRYMCPDISAFQSIRSYWEIQVNKWPEFTANGHLPYTAFHITHSLDTCWRLCLCFVSLASPSAASSSDNSALSSSSSSSSRTV